MSQSGPSGFRKFFSKKVDEDKVEEEILSMVEEGHEQGLIEEGEMEPFVSDLEMSVSGKTIGLFGSYGWGDGQWMRDWVDRMTSAGATVVDGEGVICMGAPDADATAQCEALGARLASLA